MTTVNTLDNLPGLDDRKMNQLIALTAAQQVTGPITEWADIDAFVHEFKGFLAQSPDEADLLYRRWVLLVATKERRGIPDRDAAKLRKTVDDVYRKL